MIQSWLDRSNEHLLGLDDPERSELTALGVQVKITKDELVFHAGCISDYVYILIDGRVKIYELTADGREVILWFCFPGEMFGLAETMRGSLRRVHAQACSHVTLLKIKHEHFMQYLKANAQMSFAVMQLFACRLRELSDMMTNLVADDVRSRVIKLLTRLGSRYGEAENQDIKLDLALTHQEMADMIGTTRQTVTTVLNQLKREGLLRIHNKTIYLNQADWANTLASINASNQASTAIFSHIEQSA